MRKIFRMTAIIIVSLIGLVLISGIIFLNVHPGFGKVPGKKQKEQFSKSENYKDGKFENQHDSPMNIHFLKVIKEMTRKAPNRNPKSNIDVQKLDSTTIANGSGATQLTWFGHSTFLLQMDGKKILLDPMFGQSPSPTNLMGVKRYSDKLPITPEELPFIDVVILSHDHYDHLDHGSIVKLKDKVGHFYAPLGVGSHLISWGVRPEIITEFDWWEQVAFDSISLVCTPARHFSGRGLFDRGTTLWCGWVIRGAKDNIFFSGDSGYDTHFKEIGDKFGPFDIALMECGQYNEDWKYIHMMPEETIQAAVDVNSKIVMPIHWGGFTLAFHDWTDPVERAVAKAKELNIPITTPRIGESILLQKTQYPQAEWWEEYVH